MLIMATKEEKLLGTIIGAGLGGIIALRRESLNNIQTLNYKHMLQGVLIGGISGYSLASIFGSPNDTVNYTHYLKGKRVYEGITYSHRFNQRMAEHRANGKLFTKAVKDSPKPRVEALKIERLRIIKYKPKNNIQFNPKKNKI